MTVEWKYFEKDMDDLEAWETKCETMSLRLVHMKTEEWLGNIEYYLLDRDFDLKSTTEVAAKEELLEIARGILRKSIEQLEGDPDELRFVQISYTDNALCGLTSEGVVYIQIHRDTPWERVSMMMSKKQ